MRQEGLTRNHDAVSMDFDRFSENFASRHAAGGCSFALNHAYCAVAMNQNKVERHLNKQGFP